MIISRTLKIFALIAVAISIASLRASQNHSPMTLAAVLAGLDDQAKSFHSLSADIERTKVTVVVNDKSTETGNILVHGDKMLLQMKMPNQRTILRSGDNLSVYTPGLNRVEEYDLGKNRDAIDQFVLLGFGTPGKDLDKGYAISLIGEPSVGETKTAEIELIPKSKAVLAQISKIQIWLDENSWLPVQQQFYETGSGDYFTVRYSKVVRNPSIPDSQFKPHWPKNATKVKPQG